MKKKSHERAPDKKGFSVALPKKLVAEIQEIAKHETRSRNGQIEKFLEDCVRLYKEGKNLKCLEDICESDSHHKAKSSRSGPA